MIKPNKNKLIPCADVAWGDIKGSISMQSDLMSLLSDYATESWVSEQGFMTSESLSGYATESWVEGQEYITSEALAGYATESWVSEQGFLSEVPSDYATKNWVNNKNFATKSWVSSNFLSEVPSQYATQSWVINKNYASKSWVSSNFLSEVPSEYATKSWVESNGYLSEIPSEYATKEWVSNKDYASKVWVYEQKYLKKVPSEYATQSWVSETLSSYATESWVISTLSSYTPDMSSYATKSWVEDKGYITSSALSGYATESWVESQNYVSAGNQNLAPLFSKSNGFLKYGLTAQGSTVGMIDAPFMTENYLQNNDWYQTCPIFNINGDIIAYTPYDENIYKFNTDTYQFEILAVANGKPPFEDKPMWTDASGNVYQGINRKLDLETGYFEDRWDDIIYDGQGNEYDTVACYVAAMNTLHNIFNINGHIYLLYYDLSVAFVFDESQQRFTSVIPFTGASSENFYRWTCNYNGHIVYKRSNGDMYEIREVIENGDVVGIECALLSEPYFPTSYYSEAYGETYGIGCEFVKQLTINNVVRTFWVYNPFGENGGEFPVLELINGSWTETSMVSTRRSSQSGAAGGECIFGLCYEDIGKVQLYNFGPDKMFYGWGQALEQKDLSGYATESWVQNQGYLTAVPGTYVEDPHHYLSLSGAAARLSNGQNIATTAQCIMNRTEQPIGPEFNEVGYVDTYVANRFFITSSGRLIYCNGNSFNEWDGSNSYWIAGNWSVEIWDTSQIKKTTDGNAFYLDLNLGNVYLWDDMNSDWTYLCEIPPHEDREDFWICGTTLRCGDSVKLIENSGSWSWETVTQLSEYHKGYSIACNSNVYVISQRMIYQYDESTTAYTLLGYCNYEYNNNYFVYDDELYGCIEFMNFVFKVDFTQVDPYNPYKNICVSTNIINYGSSTYEHFYGEYDNKLYTVTENNELGYCYGVEESVPEVPNTNGTYVLKAVRTNAGVTYSWVEDVDAQAIQITNQILG